MKKVLFVTYDSPNIDRRIYLFADALEEFGYDVTILAPCADVELGFEHLKVINVYEKSKLNIVSCKEKLRKLMPTIFFKTLKKLYRHILCKNKYSYGIDAMTKKATSIVADYYIAIDLLTLPIVNECIKANGGKFIYDAHEFFLGQDVFSKEQFKLLNELEENIYPKIDYLITVNNDIADLFNNKYGKKPQKIIYNATNIPSVQNKFLHDLIGIKHDVKILLYQGGFIDKRNLCELVEIGQYLNECVLVMLGYGYKQYDLEKIAQNNGSINKRVFFVPKISQSELVSYTKSAFLGIIPYGAIDINTKFCTPNKLFEFICAKLPIVFNDELETVKKIVSSNGFGISIDIKDPVKSAHIIDNICRDKDLIEQFKQNLDKKYINFTWNMEKDKLKDVFYEINSRVKV